MYLYVERNMYCDKSKQLRALVTACKHSAKDYRQLPGDRKLLQFLALYPQAREIRGLHGRLVSGKLLIIMGVGVGGESELLHHGIQFFFLVFDGLSSLFVLDRHSTAEWQ